MRPRREPPTAEHMIEVLRDDLYAPPFAVFSNVRSAVGARVAGLRIADVVAVDTREGPGLSLHAIEIKRDPADVAREVGDLSKSEEIGQHCETFELVVPAPAKSFLPTKFQLPRWWGLTEVDGRRAVRLVHPERLRPSPPPDGFLKALLRAAARPVERDQAGAGDVPLRSITRHLGREYVALDCGHRALRPLAKNAPPRIPCYSCAGNVPTDPGVIAAALEDAEPAQLEEYLALVTSRLRNLRPGLASPPALPGLASTGADQAEPASRVA